MKLQTQPYFRLSLVSPKNNVCEPEPGNNFCDVMTFVSLWPIRFHDRMKLECSPQQIPRAVVLGLLELNCDWLKIPTSQKSFPGSGSQTLFSMETSDRRKYVCVHRLCWWGLLFQFLVLDEIYWVMWFSAMFCMVFWFLIGPYTPSGRYVEISHFMSRICLYVTKAYTGM